MILWPLVLSPVLFLDFASAADGGGGGDRCQPPAKKCDLTRQFLYVLILLSLDTPNLTIGRSTTYLEKCLERREKTAQLTKFKIQSCVRVVSDNKQDHLILRSTISGGCCASCLLMQGQEHMHELVCVC